MLTLPDDRIPNWPKSSVVVCSNCQDEGQIIVSYRLPAAVTRIGKRTVPRPTDRAPHDKHEEMGPCPYCAMGFRIEFGIGVKTNSHGEPIDQWWPNPRGGPWGTDGYWQGRPIGYT